MVTVDTQTNNAQEIQLQADHSLYPNQDKPTQQQIDIIYDTRAAISMMPAQYTRHAWTNSRPCLHTLTGCFIGQSESNLMIGEFHALLTLDSGEIKRIIIIPECVQIPAGMSSTNLLADTAFLMAGHKYVSDFHHPKP
jgi:hypothetical protein